MKTISSPFDKFAITKLQPHNHIAEWLSIVRQRLHSSTVPTHRSGTLSSEFLLDMAQVGETVLLCLSVENEQVPQCRTSLIDVKFGHHALQNLPHLCEQLRQNLLENLELFLATNVMGGGALDEQIRNEVEAGNVLHCRVSTRVNGRTFLEGYSTPWGQPPSPFQNHWRNDMARIGYGMHPLQSPIHAHNAMHVPGVVPKAYRAADAHEASPPQQREEPAGEMGSDDSYRQEFDKYDFEALNQKFLELVVEKTPEHLKTDWSLKDYEFEAILIGSEVVLCWKAWHEGFWRVILSGQKSMSEMTDNTEMGRTVLQELGTWTSMGEWPATDRVKDIEAQTTCVSAKKTIRRTGVFNSDAVG